MYNKDVIQIQTFCERIIDLYHERDILEKYIEGLMEEVAPNTFALVGATLGAKFIAIAGGLVNLAKKPASTIQVLGAEKALFRSLTTGARPPKHGIIFQHTLIHGSKRWLRGKIARIFAGRLAIAIRTDAFSNKYIGDVLKEDLKKRIREIEKKKVKPKLKSNQPYKSHFKVKRRKKYGRKG
jgi:nucleolar protein 56